MKRHIDLLSLAALVTGALASVGAAQTPAKVTYNDHVLPIFRNACLNCHNPDKKKAGLDLSTYQAAITGSDNGKIVESGNAGASLLFKCVKGTEEPKMPPKGDRLTDNELAVLEKWIAGQLLETANSKGMAASNNVQLAVVSLERPAGPPPMPGDLPLEPFVQPRASNALVALGASPWAPLVAIGGQKQIVLYNVETLQPLGVLPFPEGFPAVIRFSRNGELLLTGGGLGGKSGHVALWEIKSGERAGTVGNEFDQVLGADISPDHGHVALGGPSKVLKIYNTKDGKLLHSVKKHTDWVTAVTFSPDGKYLASADRSGAIVVWEGATGKEFNTLPGHKVMVTSLTFMPGILASGSLDGTIVLWDVKEGKEIRKWNAHAGGVESVDFTPDGRLVSSGRDKLAKAWDQTGKVLFTSAPFGDIALRAALNSERVVAGDWTGSIKVFAVEGAKPLGELTANPPPLAQQLAAAEKKVAEAAAAVQPLQQQLAALEQKQKEEGATAAVAVSNTQEVASEDPKKRADEIAGKIQQLNGELAKLREQRAAAKEGSPEYAAADAKVQAKKAEIAQTESSTAVAKVVPAGDAKPTGISEQITKLRVDLDAQNAALTSAQGELARWQRAQSFMRVHNARAAYVSKKERHEELLVTIKDALLPIEQVKTQISLLEKRATELPSKIEIAQAEFDKAQAQLTALKSQNVVNERAVKEKAAALKAATEGLAKAEAELGELKKKGDAPQKEIAAAQKAFDELNAENTRRGEARAKHAEGTPEYAAADAQVQELKPKLAEATTKLEQANATSLAAKTSLDAAVAKSAGLKAQMEAATAELPKLREALDKTSTEIKAAVVLAATSERGLTTLRKESEAAVKSMAELRKQLPEATKAAHLAKAAAEKEAATLGNELPTAKVQAEQVKAEFDAKYQPPSRSAAHGAGAPDAKS